MRHNHQPAIERGRTWRATLSGRQRVLLHAQPILQMRQHWSQRDDIEAGYDPLCLSMKLFDVVIDQSGFGHEVGESSFWYYDYLSNKMEVEID